MQKKILLNSWEGSDNEDLNIKHCDVFISMDNSDLLFLIEAIAKEKE